MKKMTDESKWTINERQRKRIEEGSLTKFSDEQKKELQKISKSIAKSLGVTENVQEKK